MITQIRPYQLFAMAPEGNITLPMPRRKGSLSATPNLLENFLLIAAARSVSARRVFEFGTCYGTTTLNLAVNTQAQIWTIDLGEPLPYQAPEDAPYTRFHLSGNPDYHGRPEASRITKLTGDSRTFDFSPYSASIDLVFIDGGHDRDTVERDTQNAFAMTSKNGVIAWHDYNEPRHPDVTEFLDSRPEDIYHVEDTRLCFWFASATPERKS
jgi:hypothetical protein